MKPIFHTATAATLGTALMFASPAAANEDNGDSALSASVLEAIREFNERAPGTPNEVLVVLDPPDEKDDNGDIDDPEPGEVDDVVAAILADEPETDEPAAVDADEEDPAAGQSAPHGPQVRVHSLRDTTGTDVRAEDIEITTPFAAKPLGSPPAGWKLVSSPDATEFTENIEVAPGTWLTLSIRPHVLTPEADGHDVFHIAEPGFDPAHGYRQEATVGAAISSSLRQLEEDARVLGHVIDELEQILISLPRPDNLHPNNEEISE